MASNAAKPMDKPAAAPAESKPEQKQKAALEEDDEFEDFPVEDWPDNETEAAQQKTGASAAPSHLWEESWDDDDTSDDFSAQLREELKKVEASKRR